jgi:hypothetical protein
MGFRGRGLHSDGGGLGRCKDWEATVRASVRVGICRESNTVLLLQFFV